ncbi:MAG: trigger factor [Candidatus Walczuchella monophlebidarum]
MDELNIILTVSFNKSAFKAQFTGFRKGKVPLEIIQLVHEEIQLLVIISLEKDFIFSSTFFLKNQIFLM